jgi:S1-C subfamily serine protease
LLGISETVTEGIISGIVAGPIYKTNAAIDHGNSGGVAILNKNGCALGIPTLGASGLTSGIGYIQSYPLIDTVVCNSDSPNSCY